MSAFTVELDNQPGELAHGFLGRIPGRQHQPHQTRRPQLLYEIPQRAGAGRTVLDGLLDGFLAAGETDYLVLGVPAYAVNHISAHLAQPDETDLRHVGSLIR